VSSLFEITHADRDASHAYTHSDPAHANQHQHTRTYTLRQLHDRDRNSHYRGRHDGHRQPLR